MFPGLATFFELLPIVTELYFTQKYYNAWKDDIDNQIALGRTYVQKACEYHGDVLEMRAKDKEIYAYTNEMPIHEKCDDHANQAIFNSYIRATQEHGRALQGMPSWAIGDRCDIQKRAAEAVISTAIKGVASADNSECDLSDSTSAQKIRAQVCLLYTSPSPRDATLSRMPSSA